MRDETDFSHVSGPRQRMKTRDITVFERIIFLERLK